MEEANSNKVEHFLEHIKANKEEQIPRNIIEGILKEIDSKGFKKNTTLDLERQEVISEMNKQKDENELQYYDINIAKNKLYNITSDPKSLTYAKLRTILKELGYREYYEQIPRIFSIVNNMI